MTEALLSKWASVQPQDPQQKTIQGLASLALAEGDPVAVLRLARNLVVEGEVSDAIKLYQYTIVMTDATHSDNAVARLVRLNAQFHLAVAFYDGVVEESSSPLEMGMTLMREIVESGQISNEEDEDNAALISVGKLDEVQTREEVLRSAYYNMGVAYAHGVGAIQNETMAVAWWQKGAHNGCHQSMNALGRFFSGNTMIDPIDAAKTSYKDEKEAEKWHLKGAEAGNPDSMGAIGTMQALESTKSKGDTTVALHWLRVGANCGSISAQAAIALVYYRLRLYNKSCQWSTRLASLDTTSDTTTDTESKKCLAIGMWLLGRSHELGKGVAKSREDASRLFAAATSLDVDTVKRLHSLSLKGLL
eukprot:m.111092 g.111092  ORF g.111092 m.111092 type:complete len:361 (-) comp28094_c0_seq1:53-1135(-)